MKKGYLVISRKVGDRILIGDDIEIMISDLDFDKVKADVAIRAPREIKITRLPTHMEELQAKKASG